MAKRKKMKKSIEQYQHAGKERSNNPPVGLVTPDTDKDAGRTTYAHDPHLDPQLHWAGKAEHTSFEVPTVSLHVHERIDSRTIVEAVRKRNGNGAGGQMSLFEQCATFRFATKSSFTNTPQLEQPPDRRRLPAGDELAAAKRKHGGQGAVPCIWIRLRD